MGNLIGEQLSAVTFVQDYLQLHFDGPCLTGYLFPVVRVAGDGFQLGESGYRDALCRLIGEAIENVVMQPDQEFCLVFVTGSSITFSLKEEDRNGPEAIMIQDANKETWNVW